MTYPSPAGKALTFSNNKGGNCPPCYNFSLCFCYYIDGPMVCLQLMLQPAVIGISITVNLYGDPARVVSFFKVDAIGAKES